MTVSRLDSRRSDEELMLRVQGADDDDAFGQLYDRHSRTAFRVAQAICHDPGGAEDAVQDGFLAVWRNRASFRPEAGSFTAWTMGIVRNRAIDGARRVSARGRLKVAVVNEEVAKRRPESAENEFIAASERGALRRALQRLPSTQTEVIALAYFGGLSHSEIATLLDLPAGTVKGRMRLGMEKLRAQVHPRGEADPQPTASL